MNCFIVDSQGNKQTLSSDKQFSIFVFTKKSLDFLEAEQFQCNIIENVKEIRI